MTSASGSVTSTRVEVAGLAVMISGRAEDSYFMNIGNQVRENHFFAVSAKGYAAKARDMIDIGANIGLTSALFSRARPNDSLYAIEPSFTAFADLQRNIEINGLQNVRSFQMGLGLKAGRLLLSEDPNNSSAAHLSQTAPTADDSGCAVQVETLDAFCRSQALSPGFLKLDVEGHELDVLRGGLITLATSRPVLFIEMNSFTTLAYGRQNPLDLIAFLQRHFDEVLWVAGSEIRPLATDEDLILFLHNHYARNAGVDDLLCLPDAAAVDLPQMRAEFAALRS